MSLTVIIPVKNEENLILNTLMEFQNSWLINIDHEIIIVNDNSTDKTKELVKNSDFNNLNMKETNRLDASLVISNASVKNFKE